MNRRKFLTGIVTTPLIISSTQLELTNTFVHRASLQDVEDLIAKMIRGIDVEKYTIRAKQHDCVTLKSVVHFNLI